VIEAEIGEGTTLVAMHDGSVVQFTRVPDGYDPTDRRGVNDYLRDHQSRGAIPTGLLFLDESVGDLHELSGTIPSALSRVPYDKLCPGSRALDKLMEEFR
jgi:hypothetical protein